MSKLTIHHKVEVNIEQQIFWALVRSFEFIVGTIFLMISLFTGHYIVSIILFFLLILTVFIV